MRLGRAEKAGSGVDKIVSGWQSLGWPLPTVMEETRPDYVVLTMCLGTKPHKKTTQENDTRKQPKKTPQENPTRKPGKKTRQDRFEKKATFGILYRAKVFIRNDAILRIERQEKCDESLY